MPAWFEYLWDRWFGTFAAERDEEPPRYGLITNIDTYNPIKIAFHEWMAMFRDVRRARSLREAGGYIFGPPGWRPDGTGPTAANVRALWMGRTEARSPSA